VPGRERLALARRPRAPRRQLRRDCPAGIAVRPGREERALRPPRRRAESAAWPRRRSAGGPGLGAAAANRYPKRVSAGPVGGPGWWCHPRGARRNRSEGPRPARAAGSHAT
jgi:hypothetical protein